MNTGSKTINIKPIHEFVLFISIANLIAAFGNALGIGYPYQKSLFMCKTRETITTFAGIASFLLSWIMSYIMFMIIYFPKNNLFLKLLIDTKVRRIFELTVLIIALIICFAPVNIYCTSNAPQARLIFYIPMFITIILVVFCYGSVLYYFCKQKSKGNLNEKDLRIYYNVRLYPGIMLFCLFWGAFRRLYNVSNNGKEPHIFFAIMQIITFYSYGFLISCAFIYNINLTEQQYIKQSSKDNMESTTNNDTLDTTTNDQQTDTNL